MTSAVPRITTVFQPIVELATLEVFGYEALGRARRADVGEIPIAGLLARAHREGWLLRLDRALRRSALETIAEQPRRPELRWFLNVDSRCVDDPTFRPGFTRQALDELGLSDLRVVIELGEHDPALDRARLTRLYPSYARQGFGIALDDFGRGHASLLAAIEVRPDIIKLDRSLVAGIARDGTRRAMIQALVRFAEETGTTLVAEGIEEEADLSVLRALEVRYGQGFLLGRPAALPATTIRSSPHAARAHAESVTAA